jgi:peptidoglycan hydrolase CwlO-like protein
MKKRLGVIYLFLCLICLFQGNFFVYAQETTPTLTPTSGPTPTPDNSSQIHDLQNQINDLQSKISSTQAQEKTLSSQISVMDSQIKLTQLRITSTQNQLTQLNSDISVASNKISTLETSLTGITKALLNRIIATYQDGTTPPLELFVSAADAKDLVRRANYIKLAQEHDKKLIYDTQQAKMDYENQKNIFENKKKQVEALKVQLTTYTAQLDGEKTTKQQLLSETQGSEANYQKLLSQAQAQLAGFSRFTQSQGGSSLLGNQTVCDDWGCYYNQRDSQWGGQALGAYSLASDGCLVTSMAMVYTHMGHRGVTPATINSDANNFAAYERAWLKKTITADGMTTNRVNADIDGELSAGRPVIVGISYDGGPYADHFLVLISGSGGSYMMNDPYTPNGHNISFRGRYPSARIVEVEKVVAS